MAGDLGAPISEMVAEVLAPGPARLATFATLCYMLAVSPRRSASERRRDEAQYGSRIWARRQFFRWMGWGFQSFLLALSVGAATRLAVSVANDMGAGFAVGGSDDQALQQVKLGSGVGGALGLIEDAPASAAASALSDSSYEGIIALILTALTGFSLFFFSRAREDIGAARADALDEIERLEERHRLQEKLAWGVKRFHIESQRTALILELADEKRMLDGNIQGLEILKGEPPEGNPADQKRISEFRSHIAFLNQIQKALKWGRATHSDQREVEYSDGLCEVLNNLADCIEQNGDERLRDLNCRKRLFDWARMLTHEFPRGSPPYDAAVALMHEMSLATPANETRKGP